MTGTSSRSSRGVIAAAVFVVVLGADLALVAVAGTDIPFYDEWDVNGRWLFPLWNTGLLRWGDLFRAHNEHRIVWTHLLDLGLFGCNGQWDPLLELAANGVLRALVAGGIGWWAGGENGFGRRVVTAAVVAAAFLPFAGWHNALWGFQSQVFFSLGFGLAAVILLASTSSSRGRSVAGLVLAGAGLLAMSPAALIVPALGAILLLRSYEARRWEWKRLWPIALLAGVAVLAKGAAPEHALLRPQSAAEFFRAAGRAMAWPHTGEPLAALVLNLPLVLAIGLRLMRRRVAGRGEDVVSAIGLWAVAMALAAAALRGGSAEWAGGAPSRYAEFLALLPLANLWLAVRLAGEGMRGQLVTRKFSLAAWSLFLAVGWIGLSAEAWHRVILPRARDREAPVRLVRRFQQTNDAAVFDGQPRLLVPHPSVDVVRAVLADPRLRGALPPSLQPNQPMGWLSRAVRTLLRREVRSK